MHTWPGPRGPGHGSVSMKDERGTNDMDNNCYRLGLDVGSTTAKIVILDPRGEVAFCDYRRHQADIDGVVSGLLHDAAARLGDPEVAVTVTGSVGMGIAEVLPASPFA